MIQIRDAIISLSVFEQSFACDLNKCKGACCQEGDSGAPLEDQEKQFLRRDYPLFKKYMQGAGVEAVENNGFYYTDEEGDCVTTLIDGKECAFAFKEDGAFLCAIEKAWLNKEVSFRKPVSCHLYPIRIKQFTKFIAVNYDSWDICAAACEKGEKHKIALIDSLKEALVRKFGADFYEEMKIAHKAVQDKEL